MENFCTDHRIIGCSENHAVAIGAYGHIYVWGKNTGELVQEYSDDSDDSKIMPESTEVYYNQLGFNDADIKFIKKPAYFSLKHPIYNADGVQVSCGKNFTAILAAEMKLESSEDQDQEKEKEKFKYEISDSITEKKPPDCNLSDLEYANVVLANRVRGITSEYLKETNMNFIQLFKSAVIKESSFINILKSISTEAFVSIDEFSVKAFIDYKKMRLPGNGINLQPLYELVVKCKQGKGILYVLGKQDFIIPKIQKNLQAQKIKHDTLEYFSIDLPETISCSKVCCGESFILVLTNFGTVYSWGSEPSVALGKNRITSYNCIKPIQELSQEKNRVVDIACGNSHCLALTKNGVLYVWGEGDLGKLGNGRLENQSRPEPISFSGGDVVMIRAGHNSSFCKTSDNDCYAWGDITNNRFGFFSKEFSSKPLILKLGFDVIDVAFGIETCVFLERNGNLYQNDVKGDMRYNDDFTLLNDKYKHLKGTQFYQIIGCGHNFFAVQTKGTLFSWNTEKDPKLIARKSIIDSIDCTNIPYEIKSFAQQFQSKDLEGDNEKTEKLREPSKKIVSVCCSESNTVLITDQGEVVISGSNKLGEMGIGDGDLEFSSGTDEYFSFVMIPRLSSHFKVQFSSIACGDSHMLAISPEGKVTSWGSNSYGQLGRNFFSISEKYPEQIKSLAKETITQAAAGSTHSMLLAEDGSVYVFGSAENGKLGLGFLKSSVSCNTPTKLDFGEVRMSFIDCSTNNSIAISTEGKLYIWGSGWHGQLGNGNKEAKHVPMLLLSNTLWKQAACGVSHIVGLDRDGYAYQWGRIEIPEEEPEILFPSLIPGIGKIPMRKVFAADDYSVAITEIGGGVYCWGKQLYKRLLMQKSDVPNNEWTKPVITQVPLSEKLVSLSLGKYHGAMVSDQGKVYTWGCTIGGRIGSKEVQVEKNYDVRPIDLSNLLASGDSNKKLENLLDLQRLLQCEPTEQKEENIREVDTQIIAKFDDCIQNFVRIASADVAQQNFFVKLEHKQLTRLQQEPFKCQLRASSNSLSEFDEKKSGYGSLITTYQIHSCFMYNLFNLKISDEKKLEMLNMLYTDMEKDLRMIFSALYLSKMLLAKVLQDDGLEFPNFLELPECALYRKLIYKIITASEVDMDKMRKIVEQTIQNLSAVVHDDEQGIDPNPLNTPKTSANKITAYQLNKVLVDRRMGKLKQVLTFFTENLRRTCLAEPFSEVIQLILKDFLIQCSQKFDICVDNFDETSENSLETVNTCLSTIFEPLCKALAEPLKFYIVAEVNFDKVECNFNSLSAAVSKFFSGGQLGEANERWYTDVNNYLNLGNNKKLKIDILNKILANKVEIEKLYLESLFMYSLEPFDKEITVNANSLIYLHKITRDNIENLRVNNPSYDPLALILRYINPVPDSKMFSRNDFVNIQLQTRSLRQDQSIVRCPNCEMLISRDMAPNTFKPVIEVYGPMPPSSPPSIFTLILATGPKRNAKTNLDKYISQYLRNCESFLKDFKMTERVKTLVSIIDTENSAAFGISIEAADDKEREILQKNREKSLRMIFNQCESEYKRRKHHSLEQYKISEILDYLFRKLKEKFVDSSIDTETMKKILFNIEYGASNLELEKYSDSVMFSIFMNKIREYTSKKDMSINLFENITDEMKDRIRGFMKRTLNELKKKGIVSKCNLSSSYNKKNIVFSFEIDGDDLIVIATNSPSKLNICGRDEFREEEVLFYERLTSNFISDMREESKNSQEDAM